VILFAAGKAMADWKKLTSPSGDAVYLNLDVMIGMQRNPDINITFLQSVSDHVLTLRFVKRLMKSCRLGLLASRSGSLAIFAAISRVSPAASYSALY
jgi:hypothetical protein